MTPVQFLFLFYIVKGKFSELLIYYVRNKILLYVFGGNNTGRKKCVAPVCASAVLSFDRVLRCGSARYIGIPLSVVSYLISLIVFCSFICVLKRGSKLVLIGRIGFMQCNNKHADNLRHPLSMFSGNLWADFDILRENKIEFGVVGGIQKLVAPVFGPKCSVDLSFDRNCGAEALNTFASHTRGLLFRIASFDNCDGLTLFDRDAWKEIGPD